MNGPERSELPPATLYNCLATARGVEFHLNPKDVRTARRALAILLPIIGLMVTAPLFALVGFVGYDLTGGHWWGCLPAAIMVGAFVVGAGRWAARKVEREGRKVLLVEPDGRIALANEALVPPGRANGVRVERVEDRDEDGPVIHFHVVVTTTDERVPMPVPRAGQWSTPAQYWGGRLLGFDTPEAANRFATEIAGALGSDGRSIVLHVFEASAPSSGPS